MSLFAKGKAGAIVGIDIGSSLIKIVEAKPAKDGVEITAIGVGPTPPGAIDNEIIVDPQSLGQAIRDLLKESGISTKNCISSVSGQSSVVVRIIEVPKMTDQELAETMKWEVERHVPFAADDVMMDFQPIVRGEEDPEAQNMEVLLAVAQQEVITSHIETLFAAGLEPQAIDVESLAASRSLVDLSPNGVKDQTVAIVSIGASFTEMGVYKNGLLAFPRTLPVAGDAITSQLADALKINLEEAERIKREQGEVLMDRAANIHNALSGMEHEDASSGIGMGFGGSDTGISFIPGIGYTSEPETPAPAPVPSSAPQPPSEPEFDINFGMEAEPEKPVLDFDLSDEPDFAAPAAPVIDLSPEPEEEPAETFDLSALSSIGAEASNSEFTKEQIFDAMAPSLGDLVMEIRRSIEYYSSRYQEHPAKILLCGGTAKLPGLDRLLESELGIPISLANPLENVTVLSPSLSQGYLDEIAAVLPVSVGLAIRDMIGE
ncbi:MAG: type IV pilus assembly protein PilM [Armatimonadota bacterium]